MRILVIEDEAKVASFIRRGTTLFITIKA